jgi:hypothetical protein
MVCNFKGQLLWSMGMRDDVDVLTAHRQWQTYIR